MEKILDGKALAKELREEMKHEVEKIKKNNKDNIKLAIIQVGDDQASNIYIKNKTNACKEVGINYIDYKLPKYVDTYDIVKLVMELNASADIHGILVQLPLPKHVNTEKVLQSINPYKDVDCFNYANIGKLYSDKPLFLPCTPCGIITLLKNNNIQIEGKECVILGRSNIVGKPMAAMILKENATVTIAHSKTENLKDICKRADILISAVGKPKFITDEYIKEGAVIIDVGINRDENDILCGDVDFEKVYEKCSAITPVPGGVGPLTIASLLHNCIRAYKIFMK